MVGALAAAVTPLCWLPQIAKMIRERQTQGVSLVANLVLSTGLVLWMVYGVLIGSWPVIAANAITLALILAIVGLKLRYG
jgi:MtN3 and saliva related transmembrane protein